ncbi:MAG TPA: hypothetical protein VFV87_08130 [Pirellulaceae bacterium]|nr:hypothetical protein [Pirellulaceae bacterium]
MNAYQHAFEAATRDPRYLANLDWGKPRRGHPEGTVRAHIEELEGNLSRFRTRLSDDEYWKLRLLIHTHDSFKAEALSGVPISHPQSHASLARAFLAEFCPDEDLLAMVQLHDEPHALFQQHQRRGSVDAERFARLLAAIRDWNLFSAFLLIDGCTAGKDRGPLQWIFSQIAGRRESSFGIQDIR